MSKQNKTQAQYTNGLWETMAKAKPPSEQTWKVNIHYDNTNWSTWSSLTRPMVVALLDQLVKDDFPLDHLEVYGQTYHEDNEGVIKYG